MSEMTSRQRVTLALDHIEPDRVPFDLGGFQTGIHLQAYRGLTAHLGLQEDPDVLDPVQQLAVPSERILQRFHVDIRYITARAADEEAPFSDSAKTLEPRAVGLTKASACTETKRSA